MVIKQNVRRRRQERIQRILQEQWQEKLPEHKGVPVVSVDERLDDPEYVWKLKNKQWQREQRAAEFGAKTSELETGNWLSLFTGRYVMMQLLIAALLFLLLWGLFQTDKPWAQKSQLFVERTLTEPFEFEVIARWYQQYFQGTPSFIPAFDRNKQAEKVNAFD